MYVCERCNAEFKYKCRYQQHISRKTPCTDKSLNENQCNFCFSTFKSDKTLSKHVLSCKQKYDHIRQMELILNIKVNAPTEPNVCRFCKYGFSRQNNLTTHLRTCKEKMNYQNLLERKIVQRNETANSDVSKVTNNINNGTIMNINVNPLPFGKENRDFITRETIMKLWEKCNKSPEVFVSRLIAIVHANPKHPENHNLIYSNVRSRHAKVFNGTEYELQFIDEIIEQASTNSLDHMMSDIYDPSSIHNHHVKNILDACEPVDIDVTKKKEMIAQARMALYNNCPKLKRSQVAEAIPFEAICQSCN